MWLSPHTCPACSSFISAMATLPSTSNRVCAVRLRATERATRDAREHALANGQRGGRVQSGGGEGQARAST